MFLTQYVLLHMHAIQYYQHYHPGAHCVTCRTAMAQMQSQPELISRGRTLLEPDYIAGFIRPSWFWKQPKNFCSLLTSRSVSVLLLTDGLVSVAHVYDKLRLQ